MKLLFLDIDGVLNSYRSDLIFGEKREVKNLDPVALELVRKVVKETGCVICLCSEWRLFWDFSKLGKELKLPILFDTNHDEDGMRSDQINEVLDGLKPDKYVIVDNEEEKHEFDGMVWVNVAEEEGFSYKDYLLTIEYLK